MARVSYSQSVKQAVARFLAEDALMHSAALSYFMVFSLPPMLLIILWTAGLFYQEVTVSEAMQGELAELIGADGAEQLMTTLERLGFDQPTYWATAVAAVVLLFTASTVLMAGRNALNRLLGVNTNASPGIAIWRMLRDRFLSLAMLFTIGLILSVSLALNALVALLGGILERWSGTFSFWVTVFDYALLDLCATGLLFALLFRYLPDRQMPWRDVWVGAMLTALAFLAGQYLIGYIIGQSEVASYYDAAGDLLVMMLWIFYASALFLFGAVFTAARAGLLQQDGDDMASHQE